VKRRTAASGGALDWVWLNGRFIRSGSARAPALSPVVTDGFGVYETVRIAAGLAPLWPRHEQRLRRACDELGLAWPEVDWRALLHSLAQRCEIREGRARITLGAGLVLISCGPLPPATARERRQGVTLSRVAIGRDRPGIKSTSRLALVLAEAEHGGEVLLCPGGRVLETSRANAFVVTARGIETAPGRSVLPGIARELVLDEARALGLAVRQRAPLWRERRRWREVFVSNALRGVRPVRKIDDFEIPALRRDSVTRTLQKALDRHFDLDLSQGAQRQPR